MEQSSALPNTETKARRILLPNGLRGMLYPPDHRETLRIISLCRNDEKSAWSAIPGETKWKRCCALIITLDAVQIRLILRIMPIFDLVQKLFKDGKVASQAELEFLLMDALYLIYKDQRYTWLDSAYNALIQATIAGVQPEIYLLLS